eukprot:1187445-Prorocentrum_minimum.AAC.1
MTGHAAGRLVRVAAGQRRGGEGRPPCGAAPVSATSIDLRETRLRAQRQRPLRPPAVRLRCANSPSKRVNSPTEPLIRRFSTEEVSFPPTLLLVIKRLS